MRLTRVIAKLEPGGAQLAALRLTAALERLGVETRLLAGHATREGRRLFAASGVEAEVWRGGNARLPLEPRTAFADWLAPRLEDADVVHAHMFGAWWAAAQVMPPGRPLAISEHNVPRWPGEAPEREMRSALARVDLVFAHGPSARAMFADLGVDEDRLRAGAAPVDGTAARPLRGLPSPRLVYAGRLHRDRGPDLLVEAVALLDDPPATVILGSGPMDRPLRRLVRRRGLEGLVRLYGWQPAPARFIAGSAACVVPSRHDAWSQTAVLAMGLGVPVIATAVDGLPATLGSNRGVLVPPDDPAALADAIVGVLSGQLPVDHGEARAYAQRFTPARVARAYAREYARLLGLEEPPAAAESAA